MVCHSLLQWTTSCQISPPWPVRLGWPHTAWLSFSELDKTVVLWSDWVVFCDYGFRVSALWCSLEASTVLLGFLLPRTWGIPSRLLQQSATAAPYLGWGVSPHGCPPDLERGVAPLGHPATTHPLFLGQGGGLDPLGRAPDLGHGVAPLSRAKGNQNWISCMCAWLGVFDKRRI